jgi:hypothetical protein
LPISFGGGIAADACCAELDDSVSGAVSVACFGLVEERPRARAGAPATDATASMDSMRWSRVLLSEEAVARSCGCWLLEEALKLKPVKAEGVKAWLKAP